MRTSVKLCFTALTAAILLASAVATSSAGRLEVSNQNFRVVWSSLEFSAGVSIRCKVTLEGTFHSRTIQKIREALIGYITRAIVHTESCTNGRAWIDNGVDNAPLGILANTLPWHVTYESFEGTLPTITAFNILLRGARFVIRARGFFGECIGRYGTATDNITGKAARDAGGGIRELRPVEGRNVAHQVNELGEEVCPGEGRLGSQAGDGRVTLLGTATVISIRLI